MEIRVSDQNMETKTKAPSKRTTLNDNFADNWSLVGYSYVYRERGWRKMLWLLLMLGGTVFAVYLFYGSTMDYFR